MLRDYTEILPKEITITLFLAVINKPFRSLRIRRNRMIPLAEEFIPGKLHNGQNKRQSSLAPYFKDNLKERELARVIHGIP